MEIEFSIIVPVYNSEKNIRKCLESLRKQTWDFYEVLIIDDGSLDNSGTICEEYANSDKRFKVIHQQNKGVSAARNKGLAIAKGQYIAFVDSDDSVEANYLECLKNEFVSSFSDIVFMGYNVFSPEERKLEEVSLELRSNKFELQILELSSRNQFGFTWVKAFKRTAIGKHKFDENISLFEDEIFICNVLADCKSLSIVSKPIYNYVKWEKGNLMGQSHQDYCELQEKVYIAWKTLLKDSEYYNIIIGIKANELAETFKYYFFEKKINHDLLLKSTQDCTYINECTLDSFFYWSVKHRKWIMAKLVRCFYIFKIKFAKLIKQ